MSNSLVNNYSSVPTIYQRPTTSLSTTNFNIPTMNNQQKLLISNYETYYRTISQEHFGILQSTGKISPTNETFITPNRNYASRYTGITIEFKVNYGTTNELMNIGLSQQRGGIINNSNEPKELREYAQEQLKINTFTNKDV